MKVGGSLLFLCLVVRARVQVGAGDIFVIRWVSHAGEDFVPRCRKLIVILLAVRMGGDWTGVGEGACHRDHAVEGLDCPGQELLVWS